MTARRLAWALLYATLAAASIFDAELVARAYANTLIIAG